MKTIQQIIKEMDPIDIVKAYYAEYPIRLWEIKNHDEMTIKEYKEKVSERFQKFLKRLCEMETEENPEFQGVLFVYRGQNDGWLDETVGLLNGHELVSAEDISSVTTYAYEFTEQKEALNFFVADTKLTQDYLMDVVVSFLFEISFFGFDQEYLAEEKARLGESIEEAEEMKENPDKYKKYSMLELHQMYDLPEEETYPEEDEKKDAYYRAAIEYTSYCKKMEMQKIKAALS